MCNKAGSSAIRVKERPVLQEIAVYCLQHVQGEITDEEAPYKLQVTYIQETQYEVNETIT